MKVDIQSIHFTADYRLLDFVTKKVEKVTTFFEDIKSADVYLRLEKDSEKENKTVEVKLNISGNPIFASGQSNTFESATDLMLDKLVAQVKKHKEKLVAKN
ncbi:MAG: ribosome-associated translation inhibitor RaiA [Bacteroidia bacterium]|nr:ribosome-associated translation inhibitor RaiA [Bacteroidia bacterium]MCC7532573.1 ribosome-associated translation inhibitor RaiA [Bacteroidia bacterium]